VSEVPGGLPGQCVSSPSQEIVTGMYPYSADPRIVTILQLKQLHPMPMDDTSPRGQLLWGLLLCCWEYDPKTRPSAALVKTIVRPSHLERMFSVGKGLKLSAQTGSSLASSEFWHPALIFCLLWTLLGWSRFLID
jgi:hypothetical protein